MAERTITMMYTQPYLRMVWSTLQARSDRKTTAATTVDVSNAITARTMTSLKRYGPALRMD